MLSSPSHDTIVDELQLKIMTLHGSIWERRSDWPQVLDWLSQFKDNANPDIDEQLQALRLLSNFMYFGVSEIRALLRSLYRDMFRPQVAKNVRARLGPLATRTAIQSQLDDELRETRFVSLGNPAESSALLLYYFRQENNLPKGLFIHASDIFDLSKKRALSKRRVADLKDRSIRHYVFIDDLCGSGQQGVEYSDGIIAPLKALAPSVTAYYYPLFGMTDGLNFVRANSSFDLVYPVVELDESFRAFSPNSRIYADPALSRLRASTEKTCRHYGDQLWPEHPLGYENRQLYIGFAHNTPDNSLPIFWSDQIAPVRWRPIFKRYPKVLW
jgi:hypothetical protein